MASQITRSPSHTFAAEAPFHWRSENWLAPRLVALALFALVGALLAVGISASGLATGFGFIALVLASVNIFGGFLVTQRMLAMYKKKDK